MTESTKQTLFVTGASGQLGRRVLELLLKSADASIIAGTRTPEKLADFAEKGVIVRHVDFDNAASMAQAFQGVDRLLIISTDAVGEPGKRIKQHTGAVRAADATGVKHVVYTSLINPDPDSPVVIAPDHYETEQALENSGMGYTSLRNNVYTDMLIGAIKQAMGFGGQLFGAKADGKAGYVTREDCARAAAAALASDFEGRRTLDITGPEAISQAELAEIASKVTGQTITYIPIPLETLVQNMVSAGLPQPVAEAYASFDTGIAVGKCDVAPGAVEDLTGEKPISVAEYLSANKAALLA